MAKQEAQAAQAQTTTPTHSDFAQLLEKEFRPKTDHAREAVECAVQTLAEQALAQSVTMSDDAYKSIPSRSISSCITRIYKSLNRRGED